MIVRSEAEEDAAAIRVVYVAAFDTPEEAALVAALRAQAEPLVSLVAEAGGAIVGHVMYSPVTLEGYPELKLMGLAPLAVLPAHQRRGVGSALTRAGLERCRALGAGAIVVLGHPEYYPRFGFTRADPYGIGCQFGPAGEAWMLLEIEPGYLRGATGMARWHAAFEGL